MKKQYSQGATQVWKEIWEEILLGEKTSVCLQWFVNGTLERSVGSEVILVTKEVLNEQGDC